MVFKRSVALLVVAAVAAVAANEAAAPLQVHTDLKNPVVKDVKHEHGKLILTLEEAKPAAKKHDDKKKHDEKKKEAAKKPVVVKVQPKKDAHKKKHEDKKHGAPAKKHEDKKDKKHAKQVSAEKKENGEVIKKYAHGQVRVMAKNQPAQKDHKKEAHKEAHKKEEHKKAAAKKSHKKQAEEPVVAVGEPVYVDPEEEVETTDVDLKTGESVDLQFGGHNVSLTLSENGTLILDADGEQYVLPDGDVTIDVDGSDLDDVDVGSDEGSDSASSDVGDESSSGHSLLGEIEEEASGVAKKFTELATKLTGNGALKGAAPIIFIGGAIGALAAVVGIAAIAVGRARNNAAADPESVLADATEDVEADVKAEDKDVEAAKKDDDAEASNSLDSSDSESDADEDQEEGKFTNEVASVSV